MPDKKLTDNENTKAFTLDKAIEHCYEVANRLCDDCGKEHLQLAKWLEELKANRDLINRLQAENGELTAFANQLHEQRDMWMEKCDCIQDENKRLFLENQKILSIVLWGNKKHKKDCLKQIKAEAYKECIEKVKEEILFYSNMAEVYEFLDNLLKELVGE